MDRNPDLVGQSLQFDFPKSHTTAIADGGQYVQDISQTYSYSLLNQLRCGSFFVRTGQADFLYEAYRIYGVLEPNGPCSLAHLFTTLHIHGLRNSLPEYAVLSIFGELPNKKPNYLKAVDRLTFNAIWKLFIMFDLHITQFLKTSLEKNFWSTEIKKCRIVSRMD